MQEKKILDVTCGSRTIWFNKRHPAAVYCDKRRAEYEGLWKSQPGNKCVADPDIQGDSEAHYHSMEDHAPDPRAAERFYRKPYTGVQVLIRRQGEQIRGTAKYLAENTT